MGQVVIQLPSVTVTVASTTAGRALTVDGAGCTAPCTYTWTSGSSHTIAAAGPQGGGTGTQYVFTGWSDSGAASHTISPSSPGTYTASFTTQYYLTTAASPSAGGVVAPSSGWYNSGAVVSVSSSPNAGYRFSGFSGGLAGTTTPQNVTMNAPVTVTGSFAALTSVTVTTAPPGRSLTVDSAACTSPRSFQRVAGSNHTIATSTTQAGGAGIQYVFSNWSDAGAASHTVTTPASTVTYTANFTTQYYLTTSVNPAVAGSIVPASGWYNAGAVVSVSASANTNYQFSAFSGGLSGSSTPQNATMSAPVSVTANFNVSEAIATTPAGLSLTVDGAGCTSPCARYWSPGSSHTIGTTATQPGAAGTQYLFANWSDSGALSHSITTPSTPSAYTAGFGTQYYLTTSAGAGGSIAPASGWYNSGAVAAVSATANAGYQFSGFTGGLSGTTTPQNATMSAPVTVSAGFLPTQTITTVPAGLSLAVDGTACTAPCTFAWSSGTNHTIAAAATQPGSAGVQYAFTSWSDAGPASHSVTVAATPASYTATFATQFYLTTSAGAGGSIAPASGWYNAGSVVSVSASANAGNVFSGFSNGLNGTTTPQNVTMNAPVTVAASFVAVFTETITTIPAGLALTIDGAACTSPCSPQWTAGSTHTIATPATQAGATGTQYAFGNWSDAGAVSHTVTAPASAASYTANFTTQYYLTTSAGSGGTIAPTSGWYSSGSVVAVSATPAANYQFTGFAGGLTGIASPQNVTLTAPVTVTAGFIALQTVTTVPAGLLLTVDTAPCTTPCTFAWTSGSSHILAAATIGGPAGTQSVFVAWSQGGSASQSITAATTPTTYTATYKTQYYLTTSAGTGGSISPASSWYDAGTPVSVSAIPDSLYYFSAFSGDLSGAATPQTVSLTAPKSVAASFATIPTTMVTTSPSALQVTVDGTACTAPCTFQWTPGTSHTLTAATQPGTAGAQYTFASWSQGGAASQTITASSSTTTYTAAFNLQYLLTTAASPTAGGTITPTSGWYNSGAAVSVGVTVNNGYLFSGFSGSLSGSVTPQSLTMSGPASVTAQFVQAPLLTLSSTHSGDFTQGQTGATYSLIVSNASGAGLDQRDRVSVAETIPTGLMPVSMAGTGWTCARPDQTALAATHSAAAIPIRRSQ